MVSLHATDFICTSQRSLSLWWCGYWENYADGLILQSVVSLSIMVDICPFALLTVLKSTLNNLKSFYCFTPSDYCQRFIFLWLVFIYRPCNWRKKRIHFHDFMLSVHSRLQVRILNCSFKKFPFLECQFSSRKLG